jgi:APA family basic amino acid/polyamine antiporter
MGEPAAGPPSLRRNVSAWGSFTWGYADVGAGIFVALGLVIAAAQGVAPLAFCLAGVVYILVGLGYTELASAYPFAGGGQYFALRSLGDFWGQLAGTALLLVYTADIALFSIAAGGYLNFFWPALFGGPYVKQELALGPLRIHDAVLAAEALALIALLIVSNLLRKKSGLHELLGGIGLAMGTAVVVFGFVFAWKPEPMAQQWSETLSHLSARDFTYAISLAMLAFIGVESISQAAHETRRPATIIPRTAITLVFTVFLFAVGLPSLSLGMLRWEVMSAAASDPLATLARNIPWVGMAAGPLVAIVGFTMLALSANSGIVGASRLTLTMRAMKNPLRPLLLFAGLGALLVVLASLTQDSFGTLANLYIVAATFGYLLLFVSLIKLRLSDPWTPRPYRLPINLPWKRKDGTHVAIPILALIGLGAVGVIFILVVSTHRVARLGAAVWLGLGTAYYFYQRVSHKLPLFGSVERDWEAEQIEILQSADEPDLLEQYRQALHQRDKKR